MRSRHPVAALLLLVACGGSGSTYRSVGDDPGTLELKSGGVVVFTMPGLGASQGTYTLDGEKVIITIDGQSHTFLKSGNCLEDQQAVFGRMCIGGKAGEAANASAAASAPAPAPSGMWRSTSDQGDFTLEFKPGNTLAVTLSAPGTPSETHEGTYIVEDRVIHARLGPGNDPLVLTLVNGAYETTSFGIPMKFVKQ